MTTTNFCGAPVASTDAHFSLMDFVMLLLEVWTQAVQQNLKLFA